MKKRMGLGRGLEALLSRDDATSAMDTVQTVSIEELIPGKYQPRQQMN